MRHTGTRVRTLSAVRRSLAIHTNACSSAAISGASLHCPPPVSAPVGKVNTASKLAAVTQQLQQVMPCHKPAMEMDTEVRMRHLHVDVNGSAPLCMRISVSASQGACGACPAFAAIKPSHGICMQVHACLRAAMGSERLQAALDIMPVPPLSCCLRVNLHKASRAAVLEQLQRALEATGQSNMTGGPPVAHAHLGNVIVVPGEGPRDVAFEQAGEAVHACCCRGAILVQSVILQLRMRCGPHNGRIGCR